MPCRTFFMLAVFFASLITMNVNFAEAQDNKIELDRAVSFYKSKEYDKAVNIVRPLALNGNARAQQIIGVMYDYGRGLPENDVEAVRWYRLAANQGRKEAQHSLGLMYYHGEGVSRNEKEAFKFFSASADQGYANAQFSVAYAYDTGEGVAKNLQQAASWYKKASDQDHPDASYNLGLFYMDGAGVPKDWDIAKSYFEKGCKLGAKNSCEHVAIASCNTSILEYCSVSIDYSKDNPHSFNFDGGSRSSCSGKCYKTEGWCDPRSGFVYGRWEVDAEKFCR